ncbi:MAG: DUF6090 family protein [Maribacter sp.]|nr:DUF6090 family protein [Maribacter sp.]
MIKFFRKIRQQLLTQNKVTKPALSSGRPASSAGKYLLYALGEIILVVIGILIALQINTWNEWRKDREKEKILLQDLAENLDLNIKSLQYDIEFLQELNHSSKIVLDALQKRMPFSDSLPGNFHLSRIPKLNVSLSNIAYQAMKDYGIQIITNKDLGKEILTLHEVTVPNILSTNSLVNSEYQPFDNHIVLHFNLVQGEGLTPNDYEALFTDHFYISWTRAHREGRKYLMKTDLDLIEEYKRVRLLIQNELDKLDS